MKRPAKNIKGEFIIGRIRVREMEISYLHDNQNKTQVLEPKEYDVVAYSEDQGLFMVDEWHKEDVLQLIPKSLVEKVTWDDQD